MAELGPIDTQTEVVRDDKTRLLSTLDALRSLEYLREYATSSFTEVSESLLFQHPDLTLKGASAIGTSVMSALVEPLFSRLDPIQLGEVFRALEVSREYGKRLVAHSYSHLSEYEQTDLVKKLAERYPAHGFVIDLKEAQELQLNVRVATPEERRLVDGGVKLGAGRARLVRLFTPSARAAS
jgi:hypothetical protein